MPRDPRENQIKKLILSLCLPLPLFYVYGAYNILHDQAGYSMGASAKF